MTADDLDSDEEALLREAARAPFCEPLPRLPPGTKVGKYVVGELLGRGGMGVVYAAVDPALDRRVALKVMSTEALGGERRARFVRETRSAAAASGPNIAAVYDSGEDGELVYCAMELIEGPTLRAWLAAPHSIDDALRIARGVASALARAHAVGVIHRDLKPDNVMLDAAGEPKVLDFGVAKRLELEGPSDDELTELQTREGRLVGTPAYMSPEQAKGLAVDARSDVFSFGVMLYELLAGKRPFSGKTTMELLIAIDRDRALPPSAHRAEIGPALDALVGRCLAKTAAERPTSAELEVVLASYRARGDVARRRWWPVAALAAAAATAFAMAWMLWTPGRTSLTDNHDAQLAYDQGIAALADGGDAASAFERAARLDPGFAAAHLQLVMQPMFEHARGPLESTLATRDHLRAALASSARLPPALAGAARALEPVALRDPPDFGAAKALAEQLVHEFPDDEVAAKARAIIAVDFEPGGRLAALEELYRRFPSPSSTARYAMLLASERVDEARALAETCVIRWPRARPCLRARIALARRDGECERMEQLARQLVINFPDAEDSYRALAASLAGRQPTAAVQTALARRIPLLPPDLRAAEEAGDAAELAALDGDLEAALGHARDALAAVATSRWQVAHAVATMRVIRLLRELGRDDEVTRVATEFATHRSGWEVTDDAADYVTGISRLGGLPLPDPGTHGNDPRGEWFAYVASPAYFDGSPEAARAALADSRAGDMPGPSDVVLGTLELRAGHVDAARSRLEQAARACTLSDHPVETVQAIDALGQAREQAGDVASACAAYTQVAARWQRPGRTADHARSRIAALTCTK